MTMEPTMRLRWVYTTREVTQWNGVVEPERVKVLQQLWRALKPSEDNEGFFEFSHEEWRDIPVTEES